MPTLPPERRDDPAERTRPLARGRAWSALPALALAVMALATLPPAHAGPVPALAPLQTPAVTPAATLAWGAFENTTLTTQYAGAYADALNLTGGNITSASAFVVEAGALHAEYGAFAVVNVTRPNASALAVEAEAISVANLTGYLAITGTLPAAGTYAAGAVIPLVNETSIYAAHLEEVSAYVVFANYTVSPTVLALENEQVGTWTGVNVTLVAQNWPTITTGPNGSTTVSYATAAVAEVAWVAEVVNVTLSPALPVAEFPLTVGATWNASTRATVVGYAAFANVTAADLNGVNVTAAHSGAASLNTTVPLTVSFAVAASRSVVFPNGTEETGYVVVPTVNGGSGGSYVLWDGLVLLPVSAATTPATPTPAARPMASVEGTSAGAPSSQATVDPRSGLPVAVASATGTGGSVEAAPLAPATAHARIATTGTPAKPSGGLAAPSPTVTPPAPIGTAPAPASAPSRAGVDPAVLAALVACIAAAFLAVALVRERRRR